MAYTILLVSVSVVAAAAVAYLILGKHDWTYEIDGGKRLVPRGDDLTVEPDESVEQETAAPKSRAAAR